MKTTRHPELVSGSMLRLRSATAGKLDIENNFAKIVFAYLLFNIVFCIFENIHHYSCNISLKVLFYENKNVYSCTKLNI